VPKKVFIHTLGCPKNEADSEHIRGVLERGGYACVNDASAADVVVVNTCAFIEAARRESVDAVLDSLADRRDGQKVVVAGCMVERYGPELERELPEVDAFMSLGAYRRALPIVEGALAGVRQVCFDAGKVPLDGLPRGAPLGASAFVKISEGCDRVCTFCAIPGIRGPHRSRAPEAIHSEIRMLVDRGVREVVLVGQDMSLYGRDTEGKWTLPELLRSAGAIEGLVWLRMLYQYPRYVNDALVEAIADTPAAVPYLDLSLQHASSRLVRKMKRWGDGDKFLVMIERIRSVLPEAVLRSSFIVGFPGETQRDVEELASFLEAARIDWAGFFPYSREEGTEAFAFSRGVVPRGLAEERADGLTALQLEIAESKRLELVGTEVDVLVESRDGTSVAGRTWREAPEVDGLVTVRSARGARVGDLVRARVTGTDSLDLVAMAVSREHADARSGVGG
jgi:ribosomal protein S12 methylthiotransferase